MKSGERSFELKDGIETVYAKDRRAWRRWLARNHGSATRVWLIIFRRKSDTKSVYYDEAVEEALCYGWIDSRPNKRDAQSFYLSFSPRKPKSVWSKLNKERVERLIRDGSMTPAGMKTIELARENGSWGALDKIDKEEIPEDLQRLFQKNRKAATHFAAFPASARKAILYWIDTAKRRETREKRIRETVSLAAKNVRANQYVPKAKK